MNQEIIQAIAEFLQRVDLKGAEVPAFQKCMEALGQAMQEAQANGPDSTDASD